MSGWLDEYLGVGGTSELTPIIIVMSDTTQVAHAHEPRPNLADLSMMRESVTEERAFLYEVITMPKLRCNR